MGEGRYSWFACRGMLLALCCENTVVKSRCLFHPEKWRTCTMLPVICLLFSSNEDIYSGDHVIMIWVGRESYSPFYGQIPSNRPGCSKPFPTWLNIFRDGASTTFLGNLLKMRIWRNSPTFLFCCPSVIVVVLNCSVPIFNSSKVSEKQMYYNNVLSLTMMELLLLMWFVL